MNARRFIGYRIFASLVMAVALTLAAAHVARADSGAYQQTNLVSNQPGKDARLVDPNLRNPWGIAFNAFGPVWISDNGTGVSTLYDGAGDAFPGNSLVVTIPPAAGATQGNPTGIVFNANPAAPTYLNVTKDLALSGPSRFIFATEDGVIAGWNSAVTDARDPRQRRSCHRGRSTKGCARRRRNGRQDLRDRFPQWPDRRVGQQLQSGHHAPASLALSPIRRFPRASGRSASRTSTAISM